MNTLNELLSKEKISGQAEGESYVIQWTPDVYARETLNIGICFKNMATGEFSLKLLNYFERIHCLYGKEAEFNLKLACEVAGELLEKRSRQNNGNLTDQIRCVKTGYAQGSSTKEILAKLFFDLVPLGRVPKKASTKRFNATTRDSLYKSLIPTLKETLDIEFSKYVPENPHQSISLPMGKRDVYVPFKKRTGIATLVSTSYSDVQKVKCNLFEGYQDIEMAASALPRDNNAVFILMPTSASQLETEVLHKIENQIDEFVWQLQRHKIQVEPHTNHSDLANYISDWCLKVS
ncbi:hypothetical protein [uncultured Alteromonas sp.]|uniref:hypothetical protein n=1 Tax=uncultured Alteromonas sp. TaxID=179113 RepID=UPI0030D7F941